LRLEKACIFVLENMVSVHTKMTRCYDTSWNKKGYMSRLSSLVKLHHSSNRQFGGHVPKNMFMYVHVKSYLRKKKKQKRYGGGKEP